MYMSAVSMELKEALYSLELELQKIVNCPMWVLVHKLASSARAIHLTANPCLQQALMSHILSIAIF